MNAFEILGENFQFSEEIPKNTNINGFPCDEYPYHFVVLRKGDKGQKVKDLQENLNKFNTLTMLSRALELEVDGFFGEKTERALKTFQRETGLVADGVFGRKTNEVLIGFLLSAFDVNHKINFTPKNTLFLSDNDYKNAADLLGVNESVIKAVTEVESNGSGFLKITGVSHAGVVLKGDFLPKILHERHILYRILEKQNKLNEITHPKNIVKFPMHSLVNKKPGGYSEGSAEWVKHEITKEVFGEENAILCASWGLFQIMGFNYQACGFDSPIEFKAAMKESEWRHLEAFCNFVKSNAAMLGYLKIHDFANFAKLYNGPAYKKNMYDIKLQRAFEKYKDAA